MPRHTSACTYVRQAWRLHCSCVPHVFFCFFPAPFSVCSCKPLIYRRPPDVLWGIKGAAICIPAARKERAYPELARAHRCRLVVLAVEVGGRWSDEAASFIRSLARARALEAPARLRPSVVRLHPDACVNVPVPQLRTKNKQTRQAPILLPSAFALPVRAFRWPFPHYSASLISFVLSLPSLPCSPPAPPAPPLASC